MCENNFILNVNFIGAAHEAKRQGIKFMINTEATSYWDLKGLEELGVEYDIIGGSPSLYRPFFAKYI